MNLLMEILRWVVYSFVGVIALSLACYIAGYFFVRGSREAMEDTKKGRNPSSIPPSGRIVYPTDFD